LKISPTNGVIRFDVPEKSSPRYIDLFEILERVGEVAYRLALLRSLEGVHNVFHVSQLRRYIRDESHILDHSKLELQPDLLYIEQLMPYWIKVSRLLRIRLFHWYSYHGTGMLLGN